jgi:hypothetical protein
VLYRYFSGDHDKIAKDAYDTMRLHLRLCIETRHIHGIRAADELWKKLGLPNRAQDCEPRRDRGDNREQAHRQIDRHGLVRREPKHPDQVRKAQLGTPKAYEAVSDPDDEAERSR